MVIASLRTRLLSFTQRSALFGVALAVLLTTTITLFPVPAEAAESARWVNRGTIEFQGKPYFDQNTTDNNFEFKGGTPKGGTQPAAEGCARIVFEEPNKENDNDRAVNHRFYNPEDFNTQREKDYAKNAVHIACDGARTDLGMGEIQARQITFIRTAPDTIEHYDPFKDYIKFSNKNSGDDRLFIREGQDPKQCADAIVIQEAKKWSNDRTMTATWTFYVVANGERGENAESYPRAVPNADSKKTCGLDYGDFRSGYGLYSTLGSDNDSGVGEILSREFMSHGVVRTGASAYGYSDESDQDDDTMLVWHGINSRNFIYASDAPQPPALDVCDKPNKGHLKKSDPNCKEDTPINKQTCKGGSLGWFLCPFVSLAQTFIEAIQAAIIYMLVVNPLPLDQSTPIYKAWDSVRNLANIAFVLAFFVVIFSQATTIGLTNYGVKRVLPRIVAIAILTNISYPICSIIIDIFNILGVGIQSLLATAVGGSAGTQQVDGNTAVAFTAIAALIASLIYTGAIVQIIPLIVAALVGVLITFVVLGLRQALIILLVIISPLAFVSGLLPNTDRFFRQWFEMFTTLLLMYPIIVALFAVARIASAVISQQAGT